MRRLTNGLILLALCLLLLATTTMGCASTSDQMASWVGHTEGELIGAWGPPQAQYDDARGGHIDVYSSHVNYGQVPGHYGNGYYTAPTQVGWDRTRMFYIDANGTVYSWRWQGL